MCASPYQKFILSYGQIENSFSFRNQIKSYVYTKESSQNKCLLIG